VRTDVFMFCMYYDQYGNCRLFSSLPFECFVAYYYSSPRYQTSQLKNDLRSNLCKRHA
jgi:hypothetical protein